MPWILCGPFFPPLKTGDAAGSTAIALNEGFFGLMDSATPVMVPPVPTPATTNVYFAVCVFPDFGTGGFSVDFGVGEVFELLGHEAVGCGGDEFFCFFDGSAHAVWSGCEDELCAVCFEEVAAFDAHGFGHG